MCCKNDKTDASSTSSPHLRGATHHRNHQDLAGIVHMDMEKKGALRSIGPGGGGVKPPNPPLGSATGLGHDFGAVF